MKKIVSLVLALTLALSLAACGNSNTTPTTEATVPTTEAPTEAPTETPTEAETQAPTEGETEGAVTESSAALEVLKNIWAQYAEEEMFPIAGGNIESGIMGEPGTYDMAYAENMPYNLLIPAEQIENVTNVASMIHMMNANTFTCGAFELAEGVAAADFAAVMKEAVMGNQWMCGFPERLLIQSTGNVVVVAFGVADVMDPYAANIVKAYADIETLVDEPIL